MLQPLLSLSLPASRPFRQDTAGSTSEAANVLLPSVNSSTSAQNVTCPILPVRAASTSLPTTVSPEHLKQALIGYCATESKFLVDGFTYGFPIHYFGTPLLGSVTNHPSALLHTDVVNTKLTKEISLGRIAGPFPSPPFVNFQCSPLGMVPKKEPNTFRLIHNLSYPDGNSINDHIPKEFTTVRYVSLLTNFGRGALIGKTDIEDAFRIIPIHPSCYHLFGFSWDSQFFYDRCLPMGCAESCRIFERLSCALQWVLQNSGVRAVSHILDDFIFIGPPNSDSCLQDLNQFIALATDLSIPIKHEKTCLPSTLVTVHGIELDTTQWEARLPMDKLLKLQSSINAIRKRRTVTLRQLQSVLGLLSFACRVISPGRAFLRRLQNLTCGISRPNHHIRLNTEARADLAAWHCFLSSFNGVTMIINSNWISSDAIKLYTDAASTQGFAAVFGHRWFNGKFPQIWQSYNIAVLELFPIVAALELWGGYLSNHSVLFLTDNQAVVEVINRQTAKNPHLMRLVRRLVITSLKFNIYFKSKHIPGKSNVIADKLSRFQETSARHLAPWLHLHPTELPPTLQPWHQ